MESKRVGIVGAGASGLTACKYVVEAGHHPVVFEADGAVGGIWAQTKRPTNLRTPKDRYRYSDFPWSSEVKEMFPDMTKVTRYLECYAHQFDLFKHIQFHSRVVRVDYVGASDEEMESWESWAGSGDAFGRNGGKWLLTIEHATDNHVVSKVEEVDFLILCLGHYSGLPNIPSFPPKKGHDVFKGETFHSEDYYAMDPDESRKLLKGKRVLLVGYGNSAVDIATDCSDVNGNDIPCTLIYRDSRWLIPEDVAGRLPLGVLYFNRFAELMIHKPGEGPMEALLATLLSPLRWVSSQCAESFIKWKVPAMEKHGMTPSHSFLDGLRSTSFASIPTSFYNAINNGSIIAKKSQTFTFTENGVVTDDGVSVEADVVIYATGFKGDHKIKEIFASPYLRKMAMGSGSPLAVPLYREIINPRIPQLAVVGYSSSFSHLFTAEMRCKWLSHFLQGSFRLPDVRSMEKDVFEWQSYRKKNCMSRSSMGGLHIWYNDRILGDMNCLPTKKKGLLGHWFGPHCPQDYEKLLQV